MRLRRLDIQGFKSFADRMSLRFGEGVTGVVGPNGCGKSNVVDALRWVMGEQSAKHLRGASMQDVIFAGSQNRGPTGMAEVSVTFENDGVNIPPEYAHYSEVQVTRRLFRDGSSEYEINRTPCRLKDITELFLGTGIGTKAYSIIEQGQVATIVKAKPEDRRRIIEEAAGITKYKARRQAAERKMDATNQNLLRVTDIIREVQRRLSTLRRQATKAERYRELKSEVREIELQQAVLRWFELTNALAYDREVLTRVDEDRIGHETKVSTLEISIETERLSLLDDDKRLSESQGRLYELDSAIALAEQQREHALSTIQTLERRETEGAGERTGLEDALALIREQRQGLMRGQEDLDVEADAQREQLEEAEERLNTITARREEGTQQLSEVRERVMHATTQTAQAKALLTSLESRKEDLTERSEKLFAEAETEVEAHENATTEVTRLEAEDEAAEELREQKTDAKERTKEELDNAKTKLAEIETDLLSRRERLSERRSRLTSLQDIDRAYERSPEGVRALMRAAEGGQLPANGVAGLFAELFEADAELERPLESALAEELSAVIVEDDATVSAALQILRDEREAGADGGAASIVVASASLPVNAECPSGCDLVIDRVRPAAGRGEHHPAIAARLSRLFLASTSATALSAWQQARALGGTIVTTAGEVFRPDGRVEITSSDASTGLLKQRREIRELEGEVARLETELEEVVIRRDAISDQVHAAETTLNRLSEELHELDVSRAERKQSLNRRRDDASRLQLRAEQLQAEARTVGEALARVQQDETEATEKLLEGERILEEARETLTAAEAGREALEEDLVRQREIVTALKVQVAAADQRKENLAQTLKHHAENEADVTNRLERLSTQLEEGKIEREKLAAEANDARERIEQLVRERGELRSTLDESRTAYEVAAAKVRELEGQVREARSVLDSVRTTLSDAAMRARERELELEALFTRTQESHGVRPDELLHDYHLSPVPTGEERQKIADIKKKMDSLGEINLSAIDECKEYEERYEFLKTQSDDLTHALTQLEKAIIKINRTTRKRFGEAFEQINAHFQRVFPRLFRGGKAYLALTDPNDLLATGVEIYAQPPGKKNSTVTLMSGGEQALTAVSLIFAIFLLKPSPFCLLDEVDAPLDEGNVIRYSEMVKDVSSISQFIVITHNKRTMEVADQIYGVTMEEPGVSKMVNVRMNEDAA